MILSPHNAPTRVVEGRVVCDPPRKKVAIVAFSHTAEAVLAFQDNPEWEIWGLNNGYELSYFYDQERRLRCDRWWEMHPVSVQPANDLHWLHACPIPIYVLDIHDPVPGGYSSQAVQFPLADVEATFPMPKPYWAATFAYQVALAMYEGFTDIALLGMDFGTPREWLFERPNLLFWAGYAAGRGVHLYWPAQSTLFRHGGKYGYDYHQECAWCQDGVDRLLHSWGYVETPVAHDRRVAYERRIQEAIAK